VSYDKEKNGVLCKAEPFLFTRYDAGSENIWKVEEIISEKIQKIPEDDTQDEQQDQQEQKMEDVFKLKLEQTSLGIPNLTLSFSMGDLNNLRNRREFGQIDGYRISYDKGIGFALSKNGKRDADFAKDITEYLQRRYFRKTFEGIIEMIGIKQEKIS
jgi:hypothetical protein